MTRLRLFIIGCLAVPCLAAGCSSSTTVTAATLNAPGGLVAAGSKDDPNNPGTRIFSGDKLFIANANENALQVAQLASTLTGLEFVRGSALHFPLRVLAGPQPQAIAATPNGHYIVVLNGSGETLRLIDADALTPAYDVVQDPKDANSTLKVAIVTPAGPTGSAPADLVPAAPGTATTCTAPCVGRFFVSLSGAGTVVAFEVQDDGGKLSLAATRTYEIPGTAGTPSAPGKLATHPDGGLLFVTDTANNRVARIDLVSGVVLDTRDVGDAPGAIVVSADGSNLLVARPRLRDLVIFGGLTTGDPTQVDANTTLAPPMSCVDACDAGTTPTAPPKKCHGVHPAEAAVCRNTSGGLEIAAGSTEYQALYLQGVPLRMLALGQDASTQLKVTCATSDTKVPPTYYDQWAMVALSNGQISYVGLHSTTSGVTTPRLVSITDCEPATITAPAKTKKPEIDPPALDQYLGQCPAIPPQRNRFACTLGKAGGAAVVFPGVTGTQTWTLEWEGIVLASAAGGAFDTTTDFYDKVNDLSTANIQPGDILQISTPTRSTPTCNESLTVAGKSYVGNACVLEWTVLGVNDKLHLTLQQRNPMPALDCWPTDGSIGYRIRAGGKYWVTLGSTALGRAGSGDTIGPGGTVGGSANALFTISTVNTPPPSGDACADYTVDGTNTGDVFQKQLYSRDNPFSFVLTDFYRGYLVTYTTTNTGTAVAGTLPSDMKLVQLPPAAGATAGVPAVFVSFGASNSILGLLPFDTATVSTEGNSIVLR